MTFFRRGFGIFTADGLFHSFEVSKELRTSILYHPTLNDPLEDRLPRNVSCIDYHPDLSLIVLVNACKVSENPHSFSGKSIKPFVIFVSILLVI